MDIIKKTMVASALEVPDLPNMIYKYRSWEDKYHKTILSEQVVFFSRPTGFKDPKDCKIFRRYDLLTDQEIYDKFYQDSKINNPLFSEEEHIAIAQYWFDTTGLRHHDFIKEMQEKNFLEYDNNLGVLSLTAYPDSIEMWKEYSNEHRGFVVGFNKGVFKYFKGGSEVLYYDTLPDIMPFDPLDKELITQITSKENKWAFEREYRIHTFNPNGLMNEERKVQIPKECFEQVIFGYKMPNETRNEIISLCKHQKLKVDFLEEIVNNNKVELREFK